MFVALLINGAYVARFRADDLQFVLMPANCGPHLQRARGQGLHLGAPRTRREREGAPPARLGVTILPWHSSNKMAYIVCYTEGNRAHSSQHELADCLDPPRRVRLEALT